MLNFKFSVLSKKNKDFIIFVIYIMYISLTNIGEKIKTGFIKNIVVLSAVENLSELKPSISHFFLKILEEKNILRRIYTQNKNKLYQQTGIKNNLIVNINESIQKQNHDMYKKFVNNLKSNNLKSNILKYKFSKIQSNLNNDFNSADLLIIVGEFMTVNNNFDFFNKLNKNATILFITDTIVEENLSLNFKNLKNNNLIFLKGINDGFLQLALCLDLINDLCWYKNMMCEKSSILIDNFCYEFNKLNLLLLDEDWS